jgi:RNA polymerase primary sigma factor
MRADTAGDRALVGAALAGDRTAAERLVRRIADTVWTSCLLLDGGDEAAREAFAAVLAALQANGFARLRPYDGRSRLEIFVALLSRDILAERLLRAFRDDPRAGWTVFQRFFQADLQRLILRRLPGPQRQDLRRDAYQEVCLGLIEADYRRIRAYNGSGSFTGFVLHTVDRLLIDFVRSIGSRRRLPAAIKRLPALEQEIFRQIHWQGATPEAGSLARLLAARLDPAPAEGAVAAALAKVAASLPPGYGAAVEGAGQHVALSELAEGAAEGLIEESPEDVALAQEADRLLSVAAAVVRDVAEGMPEPERAYLRIALGGAEPLPAREMARLMGIPVEEIYKLKQRVIRRLREALQDHASVKKWLASV